MSDDLAAYLLLGMNLLVVAVVLSLPILFVWWLVGRPRPVGARTAARADPEVAARLAKGERVLRRCDDCGVLWKGRPDQDPSLTSLRVRRWARCRTRARKADRPAWAGRRGWTRCPSCLSTNVRTSRAQRTSA